MKEKLQDRVYTFDGWFYYGKSRRIIAVGLESF